MGRGILILLFAVLCACGDEAGSNPVENAFPFELGTGRDRFVELDAGDRLYIEPGFQGLQHVLTSVRAWGLPEDRYTMELKLTRKSDGEQVSEPTRVRVPFVEPDNPEGNESYLELTGYALVVPNPELIVGKNAELTARMTDNEDNASSASVEVNLAWAPEGWDPDS